MEYSDVKKKIKLIVKQYKKDNPYEYKLVVDIIKKKRDNQKNRFADLTKSMDTVNRALYETPERLWFEISWSLSDEEKEWFRTTKAARWFVRTFPEFRLTEKV